MSKRRGDESGPAAAGGLCQRISPSPAVSSSLEVVVVWYVGGVTNQWLMTGGKRNPAFKLLLAKQAQDAFVE
jgi:hypothetical protein